VVHKTSRQSKVQEGEVYPYRSGAVGAVYSSWSGGNLVNKSMYNLGRSSFVSLFLEGCFGMGPRIVMYKERIEVSMEA
jgi:hypothetical protein